MIKPLINKNDKKARIFITIVSVVVFIAVTALSRVELDVQLPFKVHTFAAINAWLNTAVTICLIAGMVAVKQKQYNAHKNIMLVAIVLSVLFLLSYIAHHLFAGNTYYGDVNGDGLVSADEKSAIQSTRALYYVLLFTHIPLAGIILPMILFTAYRALTAEFPKHKKLAKITWPVWLYVAVTGVVIYWMIRPYYGAGL
jgi:putative membrane protein